MSSNRFVLLHSPIESGNYLAINGVPNTDPGKIAAATALIEYPDVIDWTINDVDIPARINIIHYSDLTVDSQQYDTKDYGDLTGAQQDCVDILIS
jgi:hypothetical protein